MRLVPTRRSVLLGSAFACLLLILGGSGFAIWRSATTAQNRIAALYSAHIQAENALSSIRSNVYLTGILTRDYLLDPQPERAGECRMRLGSIGKKIADDFRLLRKMAQDDDEKTALTQLQKGVDAYWNPTMLMLDWPRERAKAQRSDFLNMRFHYREDIDRFTTDVDDIMTAGFSRTEERVANTDRELRASLAWTGAMALILGFAVAGITMVRLLALERQSDLSQAELRRLSGQVRTAQERERRFLSRELHDEVGQMLTGLRMELSGIARLNGDAQGELAARVGHAKSIVEKTLQVVRNIAMLLRPSMLDDLGLTPAITWLAKETARTSGIQIETDVDLKLNTLPDSYRTCLYRVVQEALTNVAKHSYAAKATVSLSIGEKWLVGSIADDGKGFSQSDVSREGLGLLGMQERVRELGGELRAVSKPRQGTKIELRLPVPEWPEVIHDSNPDRGRSRDRSDRVETSA